MEVTRISEASRARAARAGVVARRREEARRKVDGIADELRDDELRTRREQGAAEAERHGWAKAMRVMRSRAPASNARLDSRPKLPRAWFMPTEPLALGIEHFDAARHDRADFDCGVGRLNNHLKLSARKQRRDDMARVYVVVEEGSARILGYHAINLGMMNVDELERRPRGAPEHGEIPVLFLGQVAVDKAAQGSGLGGILVHHIFEKACMVSDVAGCHAIILDVISDGGEDAFARRKAWYEDFGFATFARGIM